MSESFEALVDTAPDIEKLVVLNNIVNETWNFIIALRCLIISFHLSAFSLQIISRFNTRKLEYPF